MTPAEVRAAITARVVALTPDASYAQGATAWAEATSPLVPELEPDPRAHLCFFVDNRDVQLNRTRGNSVEELLIESTVTIRFLFRLRPTTRIADWDAADAARVALWRHLLATSGSWPGDLTLDTQPNFSSFQVLGEFLAVSLRFLAIYQTSAI